MTVTMDDVAKRAGVSKAAVSLALNNKPGVSLDLQDVILKTAEELGYRLPDRRPLKRTSERKSIAIVHQEHPSSGPQPGPVFLKYLEGIQSVLGNQDANLTLVTNYGEDENHTFGLQLLEGDQYPLDGVILMGWSAHRDGRIFRRFLEKETPMVVLGRNWADLPVNTVGQDHRLQASMALDHLLQLGHRKIAFVARAAEQQYDWFERRLHCYREAMAKIEQPVDEALIVLAEDTAEAEAVKRLVQQQPDVTAIFATDDAKAVNVMRGLREIGQQIPGDISVIGLDGSMESPKGYPALTTVAIPSVEVGSLGAELLLKQIENRHLHYAHIVVRTELVAGASCAAPKPA